MTIAIGFNCKDALLICTDTQMTVSGIAKLHGSKIFREEYSNGSRSAIAIAGTVSYARMAMQHVEQRIRDISVENATVQKIRTEIENEVYGMHKKYIWRDPDRYSLSFQLLVAIWSPVDRRAVLFWTETATVSELHGYTPIGVGGDLAHYIIRPRYSPDLTEAEIRPIAVDAIAKAKDWVDGCGGFTEMICLSRDGVLGEVERVPITV